MKKRVFRLYAITTLIILTCAVQVHAQKNVGLSIKFRPEAPDSFETAALILSDEDFQVIIRNLDGEPIFTEKFNFTGMDIATVEDLVQEVTNKLPDVFDISFSKDTPIYVLNPNRGVIRRSPFVPFQFFNNRVYEQAHRLPGAIALGTSFFRNDGFGDVGHFTFSYDVDYEVFQLSSMHTSIYLTTRMLFTQDDSVKVTKNRSITIPKDLHFKLGTYLEIKFRRIYIGPAAYIDWSIKNFQVLTQDTIATDIKDSFLRLQVGARASLPVTVVGAKGSFALEYLIVKFDLPAAIEIPDTTDPTGATNTVTGAIINAKFPVLGNRVTLGLEYIDLPVSRNLDDSLTIMLFANFTINDVAAIMRRAFKL